VPPTDYRGRQRFEYWEMGAITLTFDFWPWKPFSNVRLHGKYLCQVSLRSLHRERIYRATPDDRKRNIIISGSHCWQRYDGKIMLFQPTPPLLHLSARHAELAAAGLLRKMSGPKLSIFEPASLPHLKRYDGNRHKLQPKRRTTDEGKIALLTIWEQLPQEHINKAVATLQSAWQPAWLLMGSLSLRASAVTVHFQVCIFISSPTNQHSEHSEPLTDYRWRHWSERWEMDVVYGWNSIIVSYSDLFQLNCVVKVCILLINSFVKGHTKIKRTAAWNINKSHPVRELTLVWLLKAVMFNTCRSKRHRHSADQDTTSQCLRTPDLSVCYRHVV